jgi:hypothetical protein
MGGQHVLVTPRLEVSGSLELTQATVDPRLAQIETKLEALGKVPPPKKKDVWDRLQAASGLITALGGAILAFFLTGSINQALQQRQYELSAVKEMQQSIAALNKPDLSEEEAQTKAAELAAFGRPAVPAFISFLQSSNLSTVRGAERGLRFIGSLTPDAVCSQVTSIIRNRSGLYTFHTHRRALQIIGDLDCQSSMDAVAAYNQYVSSKDKLIEIVSDDLVPEQNEFKEVKQAAEHTEQRLQASPQPGFWDRLHNWIRPKA